MESLNLNQDVNSESLLDNPYFNESEVEAFKVSEKMLEEERLAFENKVPLVETCKELERLIRDWNNSPAQIKVYLKDSLFWKKDKSGLRLDTQFSSELDNNDLEYLYRAPKSDELFERINLFLKMWSLSFYYSYNELKINYYKETIELQLNKEFIVVQINDELFADALGKILIELIKREDIRKKEAFENLIFYLEKEIKTKKIPVGQTVYVTPYYMDWLETTSDFIEQKKKGLEKYVYQGRFVEKRC